MTLDKAMVWADRFAESLTPTTSTVTAMTLAAEVRRLQAEVERLPARRDEVIRMAQDAGFAISDRACDEAVDKYRSLIHASQRSERERCAKESEAIRDDYVATGSNKQACAADYIAGAIRALKDGEQ